MLSGRAPRGLQPRKDSEMKILGADWQGQQMPSLDRGSRCKAAYAQDTFTSANLEADSPTGRRELAAVSAPPPPPPFSLLPLLPLFLPPLQTAPGCYSDHFSSLHSPQLQADLEVGVCVPSLP